tara:strand:- start:609 stop:752 length:144 start_codon:yes stop_codon:yes gene_type:complete
MSKIKEKKLNELLEKILETLQEILELQKSNMGSEETNSNKQKQLLQD